MKMEFTLTEEHREIQKLIRDFAQKEILPTASERDEREEFPGDIVRKMAGVGWLGMPFPKEYGGLGFDYTGFSIAIEEFAAADASVAITILAHTLCANHIFTFGSKEQKKRYLTPLAKGDCLGAWALTEPSAGSDAGSIRTTARQSGSNRILNGRKIFITNGSHADTFIIMAKTDESLGVKGISAFIVEREAKGLKIEKTLKKLGVRSSHSVELILDNVSIPEENLIGEINRGFRGAMEILNDGRIGISAMAVGIARASLEAALKRAKEREQFERPIAEFQAIQWMLSDMATEIDAARLLTWRAADLKNRGLRFTKESSMAKLFSSGMAERCTTKAIQVHGGYGYIREYPVERYYRDARICEIAEGTSEIQRLVIAREILKDIRC